MITLTWPDKRLSPNACIHWAPLAKVKQTARQDAQFSTLDIPYEVRQVIAAGEGPIAIRLAFYPPDKRRRDRDNMQFMMKAALDGIADGLGVDDVRFHPTYTFGEPEKPGRVEVSFD